MADLPLERLIPDQPPFNFVGIDYFGPVLVRQKRSRVKRYGCIFTCLTTGRSILKLLILWTLTSSLPLCEELWKDEEDLNWFAVIMVLISMQANVS